MKDVATIHPSFCLPAGFQTGEELLWDVLMGSFECAELSLGALQEVFRLSRKASDESQSSGAKWAVSRDFTGHSSRLAV